MLYACVKFETLLKEAFMFYRLQKENTEQEHVVLQNK